MLVFNQQANIKNVNGAIADIFANRPAPQSTFYLFYSTDTQEIYYDNGTWILIGSGGGGVNIYNSDGTLTGNRTLNGANNSLNFSDLGYFEINGDNTQSLVLDWANYQFALGDINYNNNGTFFQIDDNNQFAYTENNNQIKGFYFNYGLNRYFYGDTTGGNNVYLEIWNNPKTFQTIYAGSTEGIYLNFNTGVYQLGQITSGNQIHFRVDDNIQVLSTYKGGNRLGLEFDYTTNIFKIGDVNSVANNNYLEIDDTSQLINLGRPGQVQLVIDNSVTEQFRTLYNGNDVGLKFDFANQKYILGDENNTNGFGFIRIINNNNFANNQIEFNTSQYVTGDLFSSGNQTIFLVDDYNQIIKTSNQGNDIGLKLDFANQTYQLGQLLGGNLTYLIIDDFSNLFYTRNSGSDLGILCDFQNKIYQLGQLTGANTTYLYINDTSQLLYTANNGNISNGLYCDFAAHVYQFGRATGGNTTYLTINDAATYPIQIDGTNVLSGSAGSTSGQHLKININGTDYKIELKNP